MLSPETRTKIRDRAGLLSDSGLEAMAAEFAQHGHTEAAQYVRQLKAQKAIAKRAAQTPLEIAGERREQRPAHRPVRQEIAPLTASQAVVAAKAVGVMGAVGGLGYGLCVLVVDFLIPAALAALPYIAGAAGAALAVYAFISGLRSEKKTDRRPSGNTYIINVYQGDEVNVNRQQ